MYNKIEGDVRKSLLIFCVLCFLNLDLKTLQSEAKKFLLNGNPIPTGLDVGMFHDTKTRFKIDLSGKWLAKIDGTSRWFEILVPSAYDFTGKVIFRKRFNLPDTILQNKTLFLVAYGINYESQIFINGQFLTRHVGGYTSFVIKIPDRMINAGENILEVLVSNKLNSKTTIPLRPLVWAWRNYGGIYRDIYILAVPKIWIEDVEIDYSFDSNFSAVNGEVKVYVSSGEISKFFTSKTFEIKVQIFEREGEKFVVETKPLSFSIDDSKSLKISIPFIVRNPNLWSPDFPSLYILKILITGSNGLIDEFIVVTGFREIKLRNGDIYLNGNRVVLRGISRIEDHPKFGSSLSYEEMEKDIALIKNMGANAIRLGYHPAHPYVLNLCDRYGLLVLEEIPVWSVPADILVKDRYIAFAKDYILEMIVRDRNHPSVLAWGLGNEFDSADEKARKYVEEMVKFVRSIDKRPVYYTSKMIKNDMCTDLVDFACVNVYIDDIEEFSKTLEYWKKKYDSKPVILTGYGKAVQIGNRNGYSDPLSYESQAKYILERYKLVRDFDYDGSFVWSFSDWRGERPTMMLPNQDLYLYTMGVVSYDRERRPSYEVLKALYTNSKVPTLTIGDYSENVSVVYTVAGVTILLLLSYAYYSYRWFRENFNRAVFRSHNFFADVRDQYSFSLGQTSVLAIIVSMTLGIFISGLMGRLRYSEFFDYALTYFVFVDVIKEKFVVMLENPTTSVFYFSLVSLVFILLVSFVIKFFSFFICAKISLNRSYLVAVWSLLPVIFLIPIDIAMHRVGDNFEFGVTVIILGFLILLFSFTRLVKGLSIICGISRVRVYVFSFILAIVLLGFALLFYELNFSFFAYLKFAINSINSVK